MKSQITKLKFFLASLVLLGAFGAFARADRMSDLQQSFKERLPEIKKLKSSGKVGETFQGMLEAVSGKLDESADKLVTSENADRKELYELIAKQTNTTPKVVAERNAKRNFDRAASGEYLKDQDGHWKKKAA
jgi:uncharacterized protein YdbL (DUF1318 family)